MTQHFLRSTVSVSLWCNKCQKYTQHEVHDARKGACLECIAKLNALYEAKRQTPATPEQRSLWGEVM